MVAGVKRMRLLFLLSFFCDSISGSHFECDSDTELPVETDMLAGCCVLEQDEVLQAFPRCGSQVDNLVAPKA